MTKSISHSNESFIPYSYSREGKICVRKLALMSFLWFVTVCSAFGQCTISGPACLSVNDKNIQFSASPGGGTWSISPVSVATINNGKVTGVSQGIATITYTKGACVATFVITVMNPGTITKQRNSSGKCSVWLDGSSVTCIDGSTPTYQWWYSPTGQDNYQMVSANGNGEDLYANVEDASKYKYKREVSCGGCTVAVELNSPISSSMILTASSTNVTCYGANDGTGTATVTGGNLPLSYLWGTGATTQTATGLAPGTYSIRVEDYYGCSTSSNVTITGPPSALTASITNTTNVTCFGSATGSITVNASGGWGNYSYSKDGITYQSGNVLSGLVAGSYTVRVKDGNNCIITLPAVTITQPAAAVTAIVTPTHVTCYGANDGTITISSASGGYGTYQYSINGTSWQDAGTFTGLANANYNVQMRDAAYTSCVTVLNSTLTITQPAVLSATVSSANVTCYGANNGTIFITSPTGGYGTYEYSINGGTGWQSNGLFTNLANGTYNVQIRDAAHITCVRTMNSALTLTQPLPLTITSQPLPQTDCYGNLAEFSVTASGGVGTIMYQWQQKPPGGTFTDISGATGALLSVNNIGMYSQNVNGTEYRVLVTDNCTTLTSNSAVLHVNAITDLQPAISTSTICFGSSFSYTVSTVGTVVSYQWEFNSGAGWVNLSDDGVYSGTNLARLTISDATTAQSGAYRVSITFETLNQPEGYPTCIEVSTTRTRNLVVRAKLTASTLPADFAVCYNTIPVTLVATASSGGSGPYNYQWQSSADGTTWTNIAGATNLTYTPSALTAITYYRLNTTDGGLPACGEVTGLPLKISINPLPVPVLTSSETDNLICTGDEITFNASGGTNYNFRIEGMSVQNSSSPSYKTTTLTNGQTVDVIVTSANGCNAISQGIRTTVEAYPESNPILSN